jgi:hypothetical protein
LGPVGAVGAGFRETAPLEEAFLDHRERNLQWAHRNRCLGKIERHLRNF